jgi:hypothetical protein
MRHWRMAGRRAARPRLRIWTTPGVGARPAFDPSQQIGQHVLGGLLVGDPGATDVAGSHRAVEGDQPGHAVAAEVPRPQLSGVAGLALLAGPARLTGCNG